MRDQTLKENNSLNVSGGFGNFNSKNNMSAALHEMYGEDEGKPVELEIRGFHKSRLLVDGLTTLVFKAKTDGTKEPVAIKIVYIEDNVLTSRWMARHGKKQNQSR